MLRGPWVPAFAGRTRGGREAGAQEAWWCRCHGTGRSAVGFSPARCLSGFKKKALSVLRRLGWFDVLLVAIQCSVVPGSRRSPGKRRGVGARGLRSRGGVAGMERASAQWGFRRHDARVVLKRKHSPCCGGWGGSMSFWLPSSARWSLGPGVRREDGGRVGGGLGTAVGSLPRSGPQRSGRFAGTWSERIEEERTRGAA